jgi:cell pole-organizing protein PopZ
VRRYLVVANRTLGGAHLTAKVRECLAAGPCEFHVLVPASHSTRDFTWTEGGDRTAAEARLAEAMVRFKASGAVVTGEVGDTNPIEAIGDVLRRESFDEIILSTLPPGVSRWLGQDLPSRVAKQHRLPVQHIVAAEEVVRA